MRHLVGIMLVAALSCSCSPNARGKDSVDMGDNKELILGDRIAVPVPSSNWDWYEGQTSEKQSTKISVFVCKSSRDESAFALIVFHDRLRDEKEKFTKDMVRGATKRAIRDGFELKSMTTRKSDLPWKGSIEYRAHLVKRDSDIHICGYIGFADRIYALQYEGSVKTPTFLKAVAKGTKLLSEPGLPDR